MYFLESKTAAATGKLQTSQRCPIMVTVSREAFHGFPPLATESPSNQHQTRGAPLLSAASAQVACQKREVSTEHNVWMPVQTPNKSRKCYELSQAHDSSCIATITNIYTSYIDLIQKHYSRGVWTPINIKNIHMLQHLILHMFDAFSDAKLCICLHLLWHVCICCGICLH